MGMRGCGQRRSIPMILRMLAFSPPIPKIFSISTKLMFTYRNHAGRLLVASLLGLLADSIATGKEPAAPLVEISPGVSYVNRRIPSGPWSIHIVQVDRRRADLRLESRHAGTGAVGLNTLTEQIAAVPAALGKVEVAINGDFYQRDRAYAGDSRGLQIVNGELMSAPTGGVAFWLDASGTPHAGPVASKLSVIWPDGTTQPMGLNEDRKGTEVVLYTQSIGGATRTTGGREWVLEPVEPTGSMIPSAGAVVRVRVREAHDAGNTPVGTNTWVLSMGPTLARKTTPIAAGSLMTVQLGTVPALTGVNAAIGGGPLLVRNGKAQKMQVPSGDSYEFSSMVERHPRSAVGWNATSLFFVEVDGRQKDLSVGMTLNELGEYLASIGCDEAMNLDGGGSSTLWVNGAVRNSPCDGRERPISNSLVVVRRSVSSSRK